MRYTVLLLLLFTVVVQAHKCECEKSKNPIPVKTPDVVVIDKTLPVEIVKVKPPKKVVKPKVIKPKVLTRSDRIKKALLKHKPLTGKCKY